MKWKNLMIGKKLGISFGLVLLMLAVSGVLSYTGVGNIVDNAEQVIDGNRLEEQLIQGELDHLNWANKVSAFLNDDRVTTLDVEVDDHKCGFGKWLYGEGRKSAETLAPSIVPLLKRIEVSHKKLHETAIMIGDKYRTTARGVRLKLANILGDHMEWADKVATALLTRADDSALGKPFSLGVETDSSKSKFGRFLTDPKTAKLYEGFPEFKSEIYACVKPHNRIHESAKKIEKLVTENKLPQAIEVFTEETVPALEVVKKHINRAIAAQTKRFKSAGEAKNIYATETLPVLHSIQKTLGEIREQTNNDIMTDEVMLSSAQATRRNVIIVSSIAIVIGILLALFIANAISGPLNKGVGFAKKISDGDFTQAIDIDQKDEIGMLAKALNSMSSSLGRIFKDITTGVETLSSSSTELSAISQQMSTGSEETSGRSNTVATAAEEMSSNMNSVAAAAEQASTNVGMVATSTEEMTSVINEIAQNTEKARGITGEAVSEARSASEKVDELGRAANQIGKVTETITEISEQTNLLALNATIEAARAGEAGKGFAVVANEIKELARQTAEATGEIKERIDGIQNSTEGTVIQIKQISKVVNDVNEVVSTIATAVEEQSVTTREISNNVVQASQGIQEVTENVTQSSSVSQEIAKDIAEVNQAANEMSNSSSQVNMSAEELSKLAEQLKEMVGRFKV